MRHENQHGHVFNLNDVCVKCQISRKSYDDAKIKRNCKPINDNNDSKIVEIPD